MIPTRQQLEDRRHYGYNIYGYGNLMSIASGLWSVDLQKKYGTSSGAFIPVCIYDVKKKCRDEILREQNAVCNEIVGKTML